jgi:hypothetical protein
MIKERTTSFITLFLLFCFFAQSNTAWGFHQSFQAKYTDQYILSESNFSTLHADYHYADIPQNLFQSSTEPFPAPCESEEKDQEENHEDDKCSKLHSNFFGDFVFKSYDIAFAQFEQNLLKSTRISLVVLHHSWKSFLS